MRYESMMDMISIIIATLALLFSVFTYLAHDRKLKKQEKKLNDYQLRMMEQSEDENKKAVIRAKVDKPAGGRRTLYICNIGKAKARNLIVDVPNPDDVYAANPRFPQTFAELLPNAHREFTLFLVEGNHELTLSYAWEDDYSKENKENQTINL